MKLSRHIYIPEQAVFGRLKDVAPDVTLEAEPAAENGGQPEPMVLVFTVPDAGEAHMFVLSEEARLQVVQGMTHGIVIARAHEQPPRPGG